jgi:hypothetical protein
MLRLISYLAPSIPRGFFELVAKTIADGCGVAVDLRFDEEISGPLPGDDNPFADGSADVGFVCAPTFRWLRRDLELLPVPVPADARANGRPVYFADVVVPARSSVATIEDLRGRRWAYNDLNSRSGWFSMVDRIAPVAQSTYFSELIHAGSHLASLHLVETGHTDAAAIESNVLLQESRCGRVAPMSLRTIDSWGSFPIQPIVIRAGVPAHLKRAARMITRILTAVALLLIRARPVVTGRIPRGSVGGWLDVDEAHETERLQFLADDLVRPDQRFPSPLRRSQPSASTSSSSDPKAHASP